jgi:UDP-3-O-[3-hydroxymyristoyl] glucosamine N-acyltransferase
MKISLTQIADEVGGHIIGNAAMTVSGVAPFEAATDTDITYAAVPKLLKSIQETRAGAVIVPRQFNDTQKIILQVDNPQVAFAKVIALFHPVSLPEPGISETASIGKDFTYGEGVSISSFVSIGDGVKLGDRVALSPGVVIGNRAVIGGDVMIHPNVTISKGCRIGNRVVIHAGTVVGSDGFGFAPDGDVYHKIPHTGIVQIDDDVEIGACNTIDRAKFGKTWIQKGVKTDNLVHVAHNVTVGENTVLVAQVGISGSSKIGKHAVLAGQAGISGHLNIGDNAVVGPQAGLGKSVPDGEVVSGSPGMPHKLCLRVCQIIPRLPELKKRLISMEKRLDKMEEKNGADT